MLRHPKCVHFTRRGQLYRWEGSNAKLVEFIAWVPLIGTSEKLPALSWPKLERIVLILAKSILAEQIHGVQQTPRLPSSSLINDDVMIISILIYI